MNDQPQEPVTEPEKGAEQAASASSPHRRRGVYLLPNLFTTGALFSGFYAIVAGMNGQFESAAIAIFVAMLLDGLDGRVARMTNTQSQFGAEYDSLSDMVSFGVAPALVAYNWALGDIGKLGFFAAFIYAAGGALRLARFNTQIGSVDKRYFIGLPSPAAAATVAGLVWVCSEYSVDVAGWEYPIALFVALAGVLMVSNTLYYSFKDVDFRGKVPFWILAVIVLCLGIISISTSVSLWALFLCYSLSGPLLWVWRRSRQRA
ncbi:CDP-diacylglycerol--serine O-phosphatidyltransferase [Marinobacterium sediminicola]|uniref:CDP-diacylglycerol--serine O-phosphatidyltransferase n=1 Tax=Marinobacterium sediminicola TaxID=518898 RepID=A0ABY1S469_9GAMM|nr:CDP-diacylglycerol--serine O-phosphatidyltransferase [Marinobacterium sediminicola]ULG68936.1 CDP-diacylglycerol--serine O-phosphatidyltransferase [Marinobacterium sediminicola]SMR78439.1 CDP-diacylglycerol--serine O-phosphatidyltransferase [Marinobacterium sediminicola]